MGRALWIVLTCFWAIEAAAQEDVRGILTVTGEGRVELAPDMAVINLGVQEQSTTAASALRAASRATAGILDRLRAFGVADQDLQTSRLSLSPVFDRRSNDGSPPRIAGFVASNEITVRMRDLPRLGDLLDQVVQSGANTFRGLRFDVQNPDPHLATARRAAVADARARAALYAEAADVTLDGVRRLGEAGFSGGPAPRMEAMSLARDAVPVAAGELVLSATIQMEFWLAQGD